MSDIEPVFKGLGKPPLLKKEVPTKKFNDGLEVEETTYKKGGFQCDLEVDERKINEGRAWWTKEETIRDIKKRRPTDPDYDNSTIHVPESAWNSFSGSKIQYWRLKQHHYDTIFFFKVGKFYEIFYDDALACHKELGMVLVSQVKGGRSCTESNDMFTSFQENRLMKHVAEMVQRGYKVAIVEQTETARECEARNLAGNKNVELSSGLEKLSETVRQRAEMVSRREISQIFSRGTYTAY